MSCLALLAACEGPTGPQGDIGNSGTPGTPGAPGAGIPLAVVPSLGLVSGLVVETDAGTGFADAVDVRARMIQVGATFHTNVSESASTSEVGAGGLDIGVEQANVWYAIHLVASTSGNLAAVLSLEGDVPTLPTGYTESRRVGWVLNRASNFQSFRQTRNRVEYLPDPNHAIPRIVDGTSPDDWEILDGTPDGVGTEALLSYFVPPGVSDVDVHTTLQMPAGTGLREAVWSLRAVEDTAIDSAGSNQKPLVRCANSSASVAATCSGRERVQLDLAGSFLYGITPATATLSIDIVGYEDDI